MDQYINLEEIQKKIFYSTLQDGTSEIFQSMLLGLSTLLFINLYTELIFAFMIFFFLILWKKTKKKLKNKYILPRIGYVDLHPDHKRKIDNYHKIFLFIVILVITIYFISIIINGLSVDKTLQYLPIIIGGVLLGRSTFFYIFTGKLYYLIQGGLCFSLGLIIPFLSFTTGRINAIIFCGYCFITYLLLGVYKLRIFIKTNQN